MHRALRSLLLFATLSLWLSSAGAFCVAEIAYEYVMRGGDPAPEQTLPCCVVSAPVAGSVQEDRTLDGRASAAAAGVAAAFHESQPVLAGSTGSPLRWRAYCKRSSRLLL